MQPTIPGEAEGKREAIEAVVEQGKSGDKHAYRAIILQFERQMYTYCYYILKNHAETEDAVQEIFIRAYEHIHQYKRQVSFSAWLYKMAYHCDYSASMVYYELVDDQGNVLTPRKFDYFHSKPKTEYHVDQLFSPVNGTPKSITIKPFTLTVNNKDWSVIGQDKDSLGDKTYLKDLEMTIPVQP
ncbi:sigma factor [Paenibacillus sp. NPDC093718]|uniref:sigma factor n=1 Tax=Paenibacillus sp. NPDC093718 TaxID=3390601 RepID=UPI003CFFE817